MLNFPDRFILFDLECTTWEGAAKRNWSGPGEHREVVQVGAILVDANLNELTVLNRLIRPKVNPVLSKYFTDLTGITQDDIDDKGIDFSAFLQIFCDLCLDFDLYCFDSKIGGSRLFDLDALKENCALLDIKFPLEVNKFHNINETFRQHGYLVKQSGSAPEAFGITPPARSHDALNDARGLLIALNALNELG